MKTTQKSLLAHTCQCIDSRRGRSRRYMRGWWGSRARFATTARCRLTKGYSTMQAGCGCIRACLRTLEWSRNKGPAIFIINAVSNMLLGSTSGLRACWAACFWWELRGFCTLIGQRLAGKTAGILAMTAFGLAMSWASMNGWVCSLTENFMLGFTVLAFHWGLTRATANPGRRRLLFFASGLSIGLSIAFKQIALLSAIGLLAFLADLNRKKTQSDRPWPAAAVIIAGALVGAGGSFAASAPGWGLAFGLLSDSVEAALANG